MKRADGRSMMLILRTYLASDSPGVCDRLASKIALYVIERASDGHFGYFKLVLDLVDGKLRRTAEEEMTFESPLLVVTHNTGDADAARAA